jgi:putative aminopeptidase FrvX
MEAEYRAYMLDQLERLLAIDSPTSLIEPIQSYLADEVRALGFTPSLLRKGGVLADLGGHGNGLVVTAHADEIGLIVRSINPDGSIRVSTIGGLHAFMCDQANVRVHTRGGRVITGTLRRKNSSLHLMTSEERNATANFDTNLFLYLDEEVRSAEDATALGVRCGDIVALDPQTVFTESGYLKSRFLDDNTCVAVLLTLRKYIKEQNLSLSRHVTMYFSLYEEIGHGGSGGFPEDTEEVLAVDIGCCGPDQNSDEKKVSIGVMDTAFTYHRAVIDALVETAERVGVGYALDMFLPFYGSDANAALRAGFDVRHGLLGPGVLSTHGYERTHLQSLMGTFELLKGYVLEG